MQFKGAEDPEAGKALLPSETHSVKAVALQRRDLSSKLGLRAALAYGIASMAMVFINKAVLLQYPHSMTLLVLQQLSTAGLIYVGKVLGLTNAKSMDWKTSKRLLPLSLFYNANVAFALASLKGVNIPMYIALKRLTPLAVLIVGLFLGKSKPSSQVTLSVLLIALGVIIAALGDFSFDPLGYMLALTSVAFQTAYLVLVERSALEDGLSSIELMLYNSILSLPFLLLLVFGIKELPFAGLLLLQKMQGFNFLLLFVFSLIMGIVLNYTMFLCTSVNSALTTTIVGVLKGVGTTTLGFLVLGGVKVHALNVTGLTINTCGGIWYSLAKYNQKQKRKIVKQEDEQEPASKWSS
ncbi:hypothetical protein KP509_35G045400 [Ceratopteris richardii]|uniref:Sugar phosphate transporter domain-containing protein n=1 Tax=Ceratopteris richardii TaxID=49495 RepID=A0A8T2QGI8_CERRI|nr:hypothetical protein KP509_35G045400 [Ceratopteris richardii]KAH7282730.1 hypothetical protein KP509_35G045400 [Ceratopteris richardii]